MSSSNRPLITDEMLSAYIDGMSTEDERNLIETALASDAEIEWHLSSLRQTVAYLNDLPELASPRSFALPLDIYTKPVTKPVTEPVTTMPRQVLPSPAASATAQPEPSGWWAGLQTLFQGGGLRLGNAMFASAAIILLLVGGGVYFSDLVRQNRFMLDESAQTNSQSNEPALTVDPSESSDAANAVAAAATDTQTSMLAASASAESAASKRFTPNSANDTAVVASGPILTPSPSATAASVAIAPTATPTELPSAASATVTVIIFPTATPREQSGAVANAAAMTGPAVYARKTSAEDADAASADDAPVNPLVMSAKPLAQPTSLPTPDIPLAQSAQSPRTAQAAETQTFSHQNSAAGSQGPLAADGSTGAQDTEAAMEIMAASAVQEPTGSPPLEADTPAIDSAANVEAADFETIPVAPTPSSRRVHDPDDAADASKTEEDTGAANPNADASLLESGEALTDLESKFAVDLSDLQPEIDAATGALSGQILVRAADGYFRPTPVSAIRLVPSGIDENAAVTETLEGAIDAQGVFLILHIAPGKYIVQIDLAGSQTTLPLPLPDESGQDLHIIIDAGTPHNLGNLRYEQLP